MLAILAYHKVGASSDDGAETWYYMPEETLRAQLESLKEAGWHFVDARTAVDGLAKPAVLPERAALVTFDDGYRSLFRALPLLADLDCPAIAFVPTGYIGDRSRFDENTEEPPEPICDWDELRKLEAAGVSVQSHGVSHRAFSELGPAEVHEELIRSKAVLEEGLGKPVELLSFPYGDAGTDPSAVRRLIGGAGYRAACLDDGGAARLPVDDPYALPRLTMWPDTEPAVQLRLSTA